MIVSAFDRGGLPCLKTKPSGTRNRAASGLQGSRAAREPQMLAEPKPPFAKQKQRAPGLESKLDPKPRYGAAKYKAAGKLEGKCALITGGDSGIGRAVAVMYAREGADVAISYLPEEQSDAQATRRAITGQRRRCLLLPGDLTAAMACEDAVQKTVEEFGRVDILVSNSAHQARKQTLDEV